MKSKFSKFLLSLAIVFSLTAVATSADAYQCRNVGGYWSNGHYHHAHRVCGNYNGRYHHNRHCAWRNGHRVCWYN